MAAFTFFDCFFEEEAEKVHNLGSDTLKLMLVQGDGDPDFAPVATMTAVADVDDIASDTNGYSAGGATITVTSSSQTDGTYTLVIENVTFTQSGANPIGPFRYGVIYNSTATKLIGFYDIGQEVTLAGGGGLSFTFNLTAVSGILISKAVAA